MPEDIHLIDFMKNLYKIHGVQSAMVRIFAMVLQEKNSSTANSLPIFNL